MKANARNGAVSLGDLILLCLVVVGLVVGVHRYNRHLREAELEEQAMRDKEQKMAEAMAASREADRLSELERQRVEAAERESRLRRERAERDAEREREREERNRRAAERQRQIDEQRKKAEEDAANRKAVADVEGAFSSAQIVFAVDFPADRSPLEKDGVFYIASSEGFYGHGLFRVRMNAGKVLEVDAVSLEGDTLNATPDEFERVVLKKRFLLRDEDGVVWVFGTGRSNWTEKVSITTEEIVPGRAELGGLWSVLSNWGNMPRQKYRLSLKPVAGGRNLSLGIIGYTDSVSMDKVREQLLANLQSKRDKSANIKPPRFKRFKPTVVFCDAGHIEKRLDGVIEVARKYNSSMDSRTWGRLHDEAERQERKQMEVQRENQRLQAEYESKVSAILNKGIKGEELEAEARKYVLLIERSRSKLAR